MLWSILHFSLCMPNAQCPCTHTVILRHTRNQNNNNNNHTVNKLSLCLHIFLTLEKRQKRVTRTPKTKIERKKRKSYVRCIYCVIQFTNLILIFVCSRHRLHICAYTLISIGTHGRNFGGTHFAVLYSTGTPITKAKTQKKIKYLRFLFLVEAERINGYRKKTKPFFCFSFSFFLTTASTTIRISRFFYLFILFQHILLVHFICCFARSLFWDF